MAGSQAGFSEPRTLAGVRPNDRAFLVGTTGSGKTTLAEQMLAGVSMSNGPIILDPKHQFASAKLARIWRQPITVATSLPQLAKCTGPRPTIYRPSHADTSAGCADFFHWVYTQGNRLIFIDEVLPLVTRPSGAVWISEDLARCIQMGRTRNVGLWAATQRPARIPLIFVTEAEHDFIFRLRNKDDRERMAAFTDERILDKPPTGHGFWYYNDRDQLLRYFDGVNLNGAKQ